MSATDVFAVTGATVNIAVTATASSVSLSSAIAANSPNIRIYNAGPSSAFIRWGIGAQTASIGADVPIAGGMTESFFKGQADTFSAVCAASQTATVYITPGLGL